MNINPVSIFKNYFILCNKKSHIRQNIKSTFTKIILLFLFYKSDHSLPYSTVSNLQRLKIAREFGDKAAERRANSNLGNSHIFLGEFETAAEHYK